MKFYHGGKGRDVDAVPSGEGFNLIRCETFEDANMCVVALFNWLFGNIPKKDFKEIRSPQALKFIKALKILREGLEIWLGWYGYGVANEKQEE